MWAVVKEGIENEENFIYIFGLEFSVVCSWFKWYCFYRNLTSVEGMTISWTQPALVSITSFLILLSIYYGMHQLLFGKNFYLKLEIKQEDIDKLRNSIYDFLKKAKLTPKIAATLEVFDNCWSCFVGWIHRLLIYIKGLLIFNSNNGVKWYEWKDTELFLDDFAKAVEKFDNYRLALKTTEALRWKL